MQRSFIKFSKNQFFIRTGFCCACHEYMIYYRRIKIITFVDFRKGAEEVFLEVEADGRLKTRRNKKWQ